MKDKTAISITAIISISVLEGFALYMGMDGKILAGVVAVIAGIAGYELKALRG